MNHYDKSPDQGNNDLSAIDTSLSDAAATQNLDCYTLNDRYLRDTGRVFLTGTQALVRLPMMQRELDRKHNLNTAGFISGYRGSPLGGYDQALWQAKKLLQAQDIDFIPAVNEELGATLVLGTQQVETAEDKNVDGVFAIWYGKGPGVDRAADALKHGNAFGSSPHGGVLVVAGDDHGCVSSSMPHQSDVTFMSFFMPTINPANIAEYFEFGLWGIALSRFSGTWVGFKAISETVESAASVDIAELPEFIIPQDYSAPEDGLHYRWPDLPGPQLETRIEKKLEAVAAFARANPLDRCLYNLEQARMGIVTTGKAHLDLMAALEMLGLTEAKLRALGIDIYKVGLVWPLEKHGAMNFIRGKEEILVIEEKRGIIESQIKEHLSAPDETIKIRIIGKHDEQGRPLVPYVGELGPNMLAKVVADRITLLLGENFREQLAEIGLRGSSVCDPQGVRRLPYFCSGCPHNISTKVPQGSKAQAGIGCHVMASWMGRHTESLTQMGGEGVNWVSKSRYLQNKHIFQNLGEGTYFHSGTLAIRQAIAANTNITYKILFNDAVAMTGGQPVDGVISVPAIARQVHAEGMQRIAIISDEPEKYSDKSIFPSVATFHDRLELDVVQRELREIAGVTVLIYDQTCAAEKRRRRKRGQFPDPQKRVFINHNVCEGCGDCSAQSNCLSVVPRETEQGRKRRIDQSSCNKDFSCVEGFCPSFVTIEGGALRKGTGVTTGEAFQQKIAVLPRPQQAPLTGCYNLLVGGVGGTGIVTVGALITMAAHLESKGASVLDFMGFAQKGGTVLSYVRLASEPDAIHQVRIETGQADAMIACDMVVATTDKALTVLRKDHSRAVLNLAEVATADNVLYRDADMEATRRTRILNEALGDDRLTTIDANRLAEALLGDTVFSNVMMLGFAWQQGLVPVSLAALQKAIELNGVAIEKNQTAFSWGRLAAVDPAFVEQAAGGHTPAPVLTLQQKIERNAAFLSRYQDSAYAGRYRSLVKQIAEAEQSLAGNSTALTEQVATQLFRLMAYKDEYEVARLYTETDFLQEVDQTFTGDYRIKFNMAPPLLARKRDSQGRPKKMQFGPWIMKGLRLLAQMRRLRGTPLDLFGYIPERKLERQLRDGYITLINDLCKSLTLDNLTTAIELAALPAEIRGFGPVKEKAAREAQARSQSLSQQLNHNRV
ncbi:indolepyruvate ferredoxin oxidoreductase family protein [Amphritea pacifica]|uniref:Indolepyruvate ferredoxin oxidoreductase family protein n=1 Tax=Amphritea pacifica TaxID=2811233 RepID=A0ABS2W2L5_9GAMM|nr:indolepyruvate ferredoxin oxidoreductase family protein [Amphritea pacifica]MBN0985951.1 indolepyruvate ferredoxin oxidoreductase family protein [Amphritea pacifica]